MPVHSSSCFCFFTLTSSSICLFSSSICCVKACLPLVSWETRASFSSIRRPNSPCVKKCHDILVYVLCFSIMQNRSFTDYLHTPFSVRRRAFCTPRSLIWREFSSFLVFSSLSWSSRVRHIFSRFPWLGKERTDQWSHVMSNINCHI